ncbi:tRNA lysidine(34) synthetase TilS [Candidatus Berkiella aquae]|uniref:tRNA(Ile)-lysidine synthase n=1 Tax=Candidatus Berkiella aquae TaxID=295108 RepID=A0A0Q9YUJ8_9GAMM|nr:tRNA lysidine(34) synthetase TilS [Candidatus Berkiella aquae]MCS5711186.1 tRNA lysidine(34) synthetase TilS [Candidatus Berkiella aquae]
MKLKATFSGENDIQATLVKWLKSLEQPLPALELIVAYSGGRDSHVLLHALASLRTQYPFSLRAIHINHGLQAQAKQWALHCKLQAQSLGAAFCELELQLQPAKGQSVEELAREQRYAAFKNNLKPGHLLLTAHTQDDQAETILLQLFRGAGPKGLSGMGESSKLGQARLMRPLLSVPRKAIADYARAHQLIWVEDPSNQNHRFARNFVRHEVFGRLQAHFPGMSACIARSAAHFAQTQQLLDDYIKVDLASCVDEEGALDLQRLRSFNCAKQSAILRQWFANLSIRSPSTRRLQTLCEQALNAKQDAKLCIQFGGVSIRRYRDKLYVILDNQEVPDLAAQEWALHADLYFGEQIWRAKQTLGKGIRASGLTQGSLTVRKRQGGERCKIAGETLSRPLKKILQNQGIPYWQRQQIPLFYAANCLVGVGNAFICEGWQVSNPGELGWVIERVK